jgi:hypothetical protein
VCTAAAREKVYKRQASNGICPTFEHTRMRDGLKYIDPLSVSFSVFTGKLASYIIFFYYLCAEIEIISTGVRIYFTPKRLLVYKLVDGDRGIGNIENHTDT